MATRGARALRAAVVTLMVTGCSPSPSLPRRRPQRAACEHQQRRAEGGRRDPDRPDPGGKQANGDPETDTARGVTLTMQVPLGDFGVGIVSAEVINGSRCSTSGNPPNFMQCPIGDLGPGETRTIVAHLAVDPSSPLPAGESKNGDAEVQLGTGERQTFNIRLQGPDQAPSITQISGVVTDQATGEPIDHANVILIDGAGAEHRRGTDSQGRFDIRPEPNRPIAPGRIAMVAEKTGYQGQQYQHAVPLRAGESVTDIRLVMINQQAPGEPDARADREPDSGADREPDPLPRRRRRMRRTAAGSPSSPSVMIIIGVLLVLLGVGAIALMIWRRRRDEGEDDGGFDDADDPVSGPSGPTLPRAAGACIGPAPPRSPVPGSGHAGDPACRCSGLRVAGGGAEPGAGADEPDGRPGPSGRDHGVTPRRRPHPGRWCVRGRADQDDALRWCLR